jgi:hypothetical protein
MARRPSTASPHQPPVQPPREPDRHVDLDQMSPTETASYIHELTVELSAIARSAKLDFLARLLDMAAAEAGERARS